MRISRTQTSRGDLARGGVGRRSRGVVRRRSTARRGTVLVMVVGLLAMLFMIGTTQLIVARFERDTADQKQSASQMKGVAVANELPMATQLRDDTVGNDAIAYNAAYNVTEDAQVEDFADFAGDSSTDARDGDSLMASLEPYWNGNVLTFYTLTASSYTTDIDVTEVDIHPPTGHATDGDASQGIQTHYGDADGDGIWDAPAAQTGIAGAFDGGYEAFTRIIPHGGMVLIDRMTHPALLSQVIHPADTRYYNSPDLLWQDGLTISESDERRLRRRFLLPDDFSVDNTDVDASDLRKRLPYTLGYQAPSNAPRWFEDMTPHYWTVNPNTDENDYLWWQTRMTPPVALTNPDPAYNANDDLYDRRHLVTTRNNDDILRRQREEERLLRFPNPEYPATESNEFDPNTVYGRLNYVINPAETAGPDEFGFEQLPAAAYGIVDGALEFNTADLRTSFSLRDVLVDPSTNPVSLLVGGMPTPMPNARMQCAYARAVQLASYFAAMVQHTNVLGSNMDNPIGLPNTLLLEQLLTVAQLAVNAIDFADIDDLDISDSVVDDHVPTQFTWTGDDPDGAGPRVAPQVTVVGVEKQPYITEAYVKIVHEPEEVPPTSGNWRWNPVVSDESIYAVELYNPYDQILFLEDYILRTAGGDLSLDSVNLGYVAYVAPHSYAVFSNRLDDPKSSSGAGVCFVPSAETDTALPLPTVPIDVYPNFFDTNSASIGKLLITDGNPDVFLVRKTVAKLEKSGGVTIVRDANVVVDRLSPSSLGVAGNSMAINGRFAADAETDFSDGARAIDDTTDDRLVWDSSLQRHKEWQPDPSDSMMPYSFPPTAWHFTLSRQIVFPLPWYEHPQYPSPDLPPAPLLTTKPGRPYQHNLLGTSPFKGPLVDGELTNQDVVVRYFMGRQFEHSLPTGTATPLDEFPDPDGRDVVPLVVAYLPEPVAPFPILVADRGIDSFTGGCLAFPTTSTLLLISRYAHLPLGAATLDNDIGSVYKELTPASVAATEVPADLVSTRNVISPILNDPGQLQVLDNGHMPIFDYGQICLDKDDNDINTPPQGRLDVPWGQVIFDYFTALPQEELFRTYDLTPIGLGNSVRPVDLISDKAAYDLAYANLFGYYPVNEAVNTDSGTTIGPKARGRVSANFAPWWVLDGLPVLPDFYDTANFVPGTLDELPVSEIYSGELDPATYVAKERAGALFMDKLMDESSNGERPVGFDSIGPDFAKYMVSYREKRAVDGFDAGNGGGDPGFVTVGSLCNVVTAIPIVAEYLGASTPALTLGQLRAWVASDGTRPFSYLGYLQLVAPIVRLQDWVTVKNHVFTVYNLVGDTNVPPIQMRTQETVDRTRCLYTADLPERFAVQEPVSYKDVTTDQE